MRLLIFTYFYLFLFLSAKSDAFSVIKSATSHKEQSNVSVRKVDISGPKLRVDRGIAKVSVRNEPNKTALVTTSTSTGEITPSSYNQSPPLVSVKSFKEWKNEKVQSAIKKVTISRAQIEYKKLNNQIFKKTEASAGKEADMERLEEQLKNDMFSLQVAQQLTVQDYFAIYLNKLENRNDSFKAAAQKMSNEDVEALMRVFADSLLETQGSKIVPSANGENIYDKIK